jgi:hypothetical protein
VGNGVFQAFKDQFSDENLFCPDMDAGHSEVMAPKDGILG